MINHHVFFRPREIDINMKILTKIITYSFMAFLVLWGISAHAFPELTGQVVDNANILSRSQEEKLVQILQKANPHQVVAVSLSTLEGKEIEEYGVALGRHWGIGRKGINDGVLIIIAPRQRQMRIEVGYGLEGVLTDTRCSRIIHQIMLPLAKQGKYGAALMEGSEAVVSILDGEIPEAEKGFSHKVAKVLFGFMIFWTIRFTIPPFIYRRFKNRKSKEEKAEFSSTDSSVPVKTHFTAQEEKEIRKNRKEYFSFFIIGFLNLFLIYSIFVLIGVAMVLGYMTNDLDGSTYDSGIFILGFLFVHSLFLIPMNWRDQLKQKHLFTNKEYKKFLKKEGISFSVGGRSSGGRSHSGGSSFRGGGGSFGGGGASGRW